MIAILLSALLLAPSAPTPDTKADAQSLASATGYISFKQAEYGPTWGHYRSLIAGMREYCGTESMLCEVYCPKEGRGKTCRVVYSCGDHITKSTEARSGEVIIMDCRVRK